ncbi:hypothetical protein [Microbacterium excoecariae]|uniref:hypothetical protein n=1 Tax=Microbacterium excoecariae TaxID=2715210 RepID=UPI00140E2FFB|nr:hypothetical protein [Microbacterium excoecariae]NHI17279.1 hypothetical protein [Microbacterium excoecariae]
MSPHPVYAVPWTVVRDGAHPVLRNSSDEPLAYVRTVLANPAAGPPVGEPWGLVLPGDEIDLCLCDLDADNVTVSVAWQPLGTEAELVWQFVP